MQWFKDLYATAESSIGLPVALDSMAVKMYRLVIAEYARLIELRDDLERQAEALLENNGTSGTCDPYRAPDRSLP